jgi:hypothetical protein
MPPIDQEFLGGLRDFENIEFANEDLIVFVELFFIFEGAYFYF